MMNNRYTVALVALFMQGAMIFANTEIEVPQKDVVRMLGATLIALEAQELAEAQDLAGDNGQVLQAVEVEKVEEEAAQVADLLEVAELITEKVAQ